MRWCLSLALLLTAACAQDATISAQEPEDADPSVPDEDLRGFVLRVEPVIDDVDGGLLLPQTTGPHFFVDAVDARLDAAVQVTGAVSGDRLTPWVPARLPTEPGPLVGEVRLTDDLGDVRAVARTDAQGGFVVWTLPGEGWVAVSPEDPRMPAWQEPVTFTGDTELDVDAGAGVSLWGRVVDPEDDGLAEVGVYAVGEHGAATATTFTDKLGWFELRVGPGTWTPMVTGRVGRREPLVRGAPTAVGDEGARVDVTLQPLNLIDVSLKVVDDDGAPVTGTRVALSANQVTGYAADDATFQVEAVSDSRGDLVTRVPAGVYRIELLPDLGQDVGGAVFDGVDLRTDAAIGDLVAPPMVAFSTRITDDDGVAVPDAILRCVEQTSWPRTFEAVSSAVGDAALIVPDATLSCTVFPPDNGLALQHVAVEPAKAPTSIALPRGIPVTGTLRTAATQTPVPLAAVRLTDLQGVLRGVTVTHDDGSFAVFVDWDE